LALKEYLMTHLAFIGLGTMGYPMAGHLLRAGFTVTVWNRTPQKSNQWQQEYGGNISNSPADAAANADIILTCVGRDEDLHEVLLGDNGVIHSIKSSSLVIDHSTVSANISRTMAAAFSALDCGFIDAPVSGGQQGAINGQLSIFCGGNADDISKAQPVLASYAKAQAHLGPVGHGQLAKMVNQICVAGVIQGLAEGMRFAELAGLDVDQVMQLVGQGAGSSWQLLNRHKTMQQDHYEHGFAVDWMRKDLDIVLAESAQLGLNLPITTVINDFYREVQVMGGGRWDTSSLLKRLQNQ